MKKLKCVPGTLKLDIAPCPDEPKYCLTPELVRLLPYPGKYLTVSAIFIITIIIFIIIIIIVLVITFVQGIYNYVPETNHVPTVYSVAAVLYLQSLLHVMLLHP